ncbi:MAG: BON domain-containing protein [Verrucomicrobia bacterium]|nr:BON domain-containing protein [Kiritimatiellia bacterium]MCB1100863.1 BON domain-containing protein [Kiritimatiellia bacterium]MCP5489391.1 BON domain-containing protein [Verrucomicrobiota bacterium]
MKRWVLGVLAVLALVCTGCSSLDMPSGDLSGPVSDRELESLVMGRIQSDPALVQQSISVSAREGVITLYGSAPNQEAAARIKSQIRSTPGVRGVIDQLSVF